MSILIGNPEILAVYCALFGEKRVVEAFALACGTRVS